MSTDLSRIGGKARREPELVFASLYHHVYDVDNLRACYDALPGNRAVGVAGVTKEEYGLNLEDNLQDLSGRLKRRGYRPQPKRRSYIPKPGSEKGRPLGISCFEDKIVELAVKRVLEPIYETVFEDSSHGYRPEHTQHSCLSKIVFSCGGLPFYLDYRSDNREAKISAHSSGSGKSDVGFRAL